MFKARRASAVLAGLISLGAAFVLVALPLIHARVVQAAPAISATVISGNNQTGEITTQLAEPLIITAINGAGEAQADAAVFWLITDYPEGATGFSLINEQIHTDAEGRASAELQLGSLPGTYEVVVMVEGLAEALIIFEATAEANVTTPVIVSPAGGAMLTSMGTELRWLNPADAAQYEIRIVPFNDDGPAIHLIRNIENTYTILPPDFSVGNYVMLPDMSYTWDVRTTAMTGDPLESSWSARASGSFRTPSVNSDSISLQTGIDGSMMERDPVLVWRNSNDQVFYYEVQVSADANFGTSIDSPALYWELVHGGMSDPLNSYFVRPEFRLEGDTTYFWRVRPRIQGDGDPVEWSVPGAFHTTQ